MNDITPNELMELEAQNNPSVSKSNCSGVLVDVLELLEKDLKLSQRLIDDNKATNNVEMVRTFQIKRGHTRELISQVKALGN